MTKRVWVAVALLFVASWCGAGPTAPTVDLPDPELVTAYEKSATQNVLASVNPEVFFGYFSVCADGKGHGYGSTFPALDGHQLTDALLFLGQAEVVKANFDYVQKRQRPNGQIPFVINLKGEGGFEHWVKGNPLRALAVTSHIASADVIFRYTQDRAWLAQRLPSINLAAEYLASLTDPDGGVRGAGYYVEMPSRIEYDGVAQGYAADTFRRVAALNELLGKAEEARRWQELADRVSAHFRTAFWMSNQFAEYIHPQRGVITAHGLTDSDWCAIATGVASAEQTAVLWPRLKDEAAFYYGGMPTGIATLPGTYERWESPEGTMEMAAMGRVWYVEAWARARMGDGAGLVDSLRRVAKAGKESGYYWFERYNFKGRPFGNVKYCEYPANLIRIVQRFLLGVEFGLDGTLQLAPTAPPEFWEAGFGQTLTWGKRSLTYRMQRDRMSGDYRGENPQHLAVRLLQPVEGATVKASLSGKPAVVKTEADRLILVLPAAPADRPCHFEIEVGPRA